MNLLNIITNLTPYTTLELLVIYLEFVRDALAVLVAIAFTLSIALMSILAQRKMKKELEGKKGQ